MAAVSIQTQVRGFLARRRYVSLKSNQVWIVLIWIGFDDCQVSPFLRESDGAG